MKLAEVLPLTLFLLLSAPTPAVYATDNSITASSPTYSADELENLNENFTEKNPDPTDDIEWNKGQTPSALIFDPNGVSEPIRRRNMPFRSNGAYLDTSTGDIYVDDLFGAPGKTKVMNFNGTHLIDVDP